MCLAQGPNTVTPMRLEPTAPHSRVKHSTTEPLHSLNLQYSDMYFNTDVTILQIEECILILIGRLMCYKEAMAMKMILDRRKF